MHRMPQCMLHWHISVTGHGQRMVCFPQHKPLLKWTADFTVTPCSTAYGYQITQTFWCYVICNLAVSFWHVIAHWELQFDRVPWNTFEWIGLCVCVFVCVCVCAYAVIPTIRAWSCSRTQCWVLNWQRHFRRVTLKYFLTPDWIRVGNNDYEEWTDIEVQWKCKKWTLLFVVWLIARNLEH